MADVYNTLMDSEEFGNYIDPVVTYQEDIPFDHHQGYIPDLTTGLGIYGLRQFPELQTSGHFDFNAFLAQHPELQGQTDKYNVLGGIDVAKRIQPGEKKIGYDWSGNKALSALGGIYGLWDSYTSGVYEPGLRNQTYKEGLADAYRNIKGIGIQRDWNPLGLLYDDDEADYYKGFYNKIHKDYQKMQADRWQEDKLRRLHSEDIFGGTFERRGRVPLLKLPPINVGGGQRSEPTRQAAHASYDRPGAKGSPGYRWKDGGLATMFERRR